METGGAAGLSLVKVGAMNAWLITQAFWMVCLLGYSLRCVEPAQAVNSNTRRRGGKKKKKEKTLSRMEFLHSDYK